MITMLACSSEKEELTALYQTTKNQAAYLSEDKWNIYAFQNLDEIALFLEKKSILDAVCFDVTMKGGIEMVEQIRRQNAKAYIILIASVSLSPVQYIKPTIMASSLLLKPIDTTLYKKLLEEMVREFQQEEGTDDELFILEDQEGKHRIPYQDIFCFEAREKKIYACTLTQEYGFYETLEHLTGMLPDYFVRCHRGFIVNTRKIRRVALSENMIYMEEGYQVALSRSYKAVLKEYR